MHSAPKARCSLPNACQALQHLGARCTRNTRDTGHSTVVWCVLQRKVCSTLSTSQAKNGRFAIAMGTHGAREKGTLSVCPQLFDATLEVDDSVIFVSAEPSCAAFMPL